MAAVVGAVLVLAIAGGATGIVFARAGSGESHAVPARLLSPAQRRAIEAELSAVLEARRHLNWRGMHEHGRKALALAEAAGLERLAQEIRSSMGTNCLVVATEFHIDLALRLLNQGTAQEAL